MTGAVTVEDFNSVRWHVAQRTYGNNHSTLIGLLVDWWVSRDPTRNWALEAGPSFNPQGSGLKGRGQCDALLCADAEAIGVVEVEGGGRQGYTAKKLGAFFGSRDPHLSHLQFGILLLYRFGPRGRGVDKAVPPAASPEAIAAVIDVSTSYPGKEIFVIALEKACEPAVQGIRTRYASYSIGVADVRVSRYRNGAQCGEPFLVQRNPTIGFPARHGVRL